MNATIAIIVGVSIGVLVGTLGTQIVLGIWGERIFQWWDR